MLIQIYKVIVKLSFFTIQIEEYTHIIMGDFMSFVWIL